MKFLKRKRSMSPLSTASLPDIVFMLLFFFMATTVMREVILKVKIDRPEAQEAVRLENKALVDHIYIGKPLNIGLEDPEMVLQLNDDFANINEIGKFIEQCDEKRTERDRTKAIRSLKVGEEAEMGIVSNVKQELRKANARKISYSVENKNRKSD